MISGESITMKHENASVEHSTLQSEANAYRSCAGGVGVPSVLWLGTKDGRAALVLEQLGPSLKDLFNVCQHKFSLKTVLELCEQILFLLEDVHAKSLFFSSLSADNFCIGHGKKGGIIYAVGYDAAPKVHGAEALLSVSNCKDHGIWCKGEFTAQGEYSCCFTSRVQTAE